MTIRFVTVENYGSGTDVDGRFALVSGLTIDGFRFANQSTSPSEPFVADGVELDGQYPRIEGNIIWRFHGTAAACGHGTRVHQNTIAFAFAGISLANSDSMVSDNFVYGHRDECLLIEAGSGNNHTSNNHFFGSGNYVARNNGGGGWHSSNDIFADAAYGIHNGGHGCAFVGAKVQHCYKSGIKETSNSNAYTGCMVDAQLKVGPSAPDGCIGVEFIGDRNRFIGGKIELTNWAVHVPPEHPEPVAADAAVQCNGDACVFDTKLVDNDDENGSIGHKIPSAVNGQKIRYETYGFHDPTDRIFVMTGDAATNSDGLDLEFRVAGRTSKALADYFDIGTGWTGSIVVKDIDAGTTTPLTEGQAY